MKGRNHPVIRQDERAHALATGEAVALFHESTPLDLILSTRPDALVKGADCTEDEMVGAIEAESWGGELVLVPLVDSRSTTSIPNRLHAVQAQP